jgi:hypothetical protein
VISKPISPKVRDAFQRHTIELPKSFVGLDAKVALRPFRANLDPRHT